MRAFIFVLTACFCSVSLATEPPFQQPITSITELLTTPAPPTPLVHTASGTLALLTEEQVISMERLLAPRLGLAGFRLDPITRITGIEPMVLWIDIVDTRSPRPKTPQRWQADGDARFTHVQFSPDGAHLSATRVETGHTSELWLYDIASGHARKLSDHINTAWGNPCYWSDNTHLLCRMQQSGLAPPTVTIAPIQVEHQGRKLPTRTYRHLLKTPTDDARFDFYFSSRLMQIDLQGKTSAVPVQPGVISHLSLAPDGRHLLLRRLVSPYPRLVTASQFPSVVEVWDLQAAKRLYQSAASGFGIETQTSGIADPNSITWAPLLPVTAGFLFQADSADGQTSYQWRTLQAPFTGTPVIMARSSTPIREFGWSNAGTPWYVARSATNNVIDVNILLGHETKTLWSGDKRNRYLDPGTAIRLNGNRGPVLESNGAVFIASSGLDDSGARPSLTRVNLKTLATQNLFTSEAGVHETVFAVLDPENEVLLTQRESETRAPTFLRVAPGAITPLFETPNPYPQLNQVQRRLISYPRADGVMLNATLYLPKNTGGRPLPTLVWIYPREFSDPQQAEQLDTRPFQFHSIKGPSPIASMLAGYAVVINPTVPIISDGDADNDQYLPQLVSSADAVVDYLVQSGISDPARIAIGGRSYGAFSTANLLIHSTRFASGIAMSGAYNRTLTPFGFQHEKRSFWEATDYYTSISPFFHANRMTKPLLLVHGGEDPNPGTPIIQTQRFFHALVGEGKTVRYVELPGEEHHYRGRDTVLQAAWEMIDWLDRTIGPHAKP